MMSGGSKNPRCMLLVLGAALLCGACAPGLFAQKTQAGSLTWSEAQSRLVFLNHLAEHRGERDLLERLRETAKQARQWIDAGNSYKAEELITRAEAVFGLDPGGKTMGGGAPFFRPTPAVVDQFEKLEQQLDEAVKGKDKYTILRVITTMKRVLGDQAGLPAAANAGWKPGAFNLEQGDAVDLFLAAMASERKKLAQI